MVCQGVGATANAALQILEATEEGPALPLGGKRRITINILPEALRYRNAAVSAYPEPSSFPFHSSFLPFLFLIDTEF